LARTKFLLLSLLVLLAMCAVVRPIAAGDDSGVSVSASNVVVVAGQSGDTTIIFSAPAEDVIIEVTVSCGGLPAGVTCSPSSIPGIFGDGDSFEVVVSTSPSTPPGTYSIPVTVFFSFGGFVIQPLFPISSGGLVGPESVSIQQALMATTTFSLTVNSTVIPEYPLGLPILAILTIISYGLIRRKTKNSKN